MTAVFKPCRLYIFWKVLFTRLFYKFVVVLSEFKCRAFVSYNEEAKIHPKIKRIFSSNSVKNLLHIYPLILWNCPNIL